jgi:hypothetical protein
MKEFNRAMEKGLVVGTTAAKILIVGIFSFFAGYYLGFLVLA